MAKTRVNLALTGNVIKAIKMLQMYYSMALYVIDVSVSNVCIANMKYRKDEIAQLICILIVDNLVS